MKTISFVLRRHMAGIAVAIAALTAPAFATDLVFTPIALSGTDGALGPNEGSGKVFTNLGSANPALNNNGQIVFRGDSTTSGASSGNLGLWKSLAGVNTNYAVAGGADPAGGTYGTGGFTGPIIRDLGQLSWRYGTTSLYVNPGSGPALLQKTTGLAPGIGTGATISSFTFPAPLLNGNGQAAFVGSMTGGTPPIITSGSGANASGLWTGSPGAMNLSARQNDATSLGSGFQLGAIAGSGQQFSFNNNGAMAWNGVLQGTSVISSPSTTANNQAIFSTRSGSLEVVAQRGSPAPGTVGGLNYSTTGAAVGMNNAGKIVYYTNLRNSAGTASGAGLFTDTTGTLTAAAQSGQAMPPIAHSNGNEFIGVNWGAFFSDTQINHAGTIAFTDSGLTGAGITTNVNDAGVFKMDSSGAFSKIMRTNDVAPAGSMVSSDTVRFGSTQSGLALNALGQAVFYGGLKSDLGGVSGAFGNNFGLFAADTDGSIHLIAQKGMPFEVGIGDTRTISAFGSTAYSGGNEDGRASMFNDNGDLVFSLAFTNGTSGVFKTHIPEPATLSLLTLSLVLIVRRRSA